MKGRSLSVTGHLAHIFTSVPGQSLASYRCECVPNQCAAPVLSTNTVSPENHSHEYTFTEKYW